MTKSQVGHFELIWEEVRYHNRQLDSNTIVYVIESGLSSELWNLQHEDVTTLTTGTGTGTTFNTVKLCG